MDNQHSNRERVEPNNELLNTQIVIEKFSCNRIYPDSPSSVKNCKLQVNIQKRAAPHNDLTVELILQGQEQNTSGEARELFEVRATASGAAPKQLLSRMEAYAVAASTFSYLSAYVSSLILGMGYIGVSVPKTLPLEAIPQVPETK